jgi:endonuclease/exonuclease/phosphatase family metal-dependent hydrolase
MAAIKEFLQLNDSVDIFMLQEVDVNSHRSYKKNEVLDISQTLNHFQPFFAKNYDVFFVPVPFHNPMGHVNSGLLSLSKIHPSSVERISFPGQYNWPLRLFMLDRCFLVMHFPIANGNELLVINTHNEAYDDGSIRNMQMDFLKNYLLKEYEKGKFIIVGGDWNQCPPGFTPQFKDEVFDSINNKGVEPDFLPSGWQWVYDNRFPTNRRVDISYTKGTTATTLIDFYLLSPNIHYNQIKTTDLRFEHSDHLPVQITVTLSK